MTTSPTTSRLRFAAKAIATTLLISIGAAHADVVMLTNGDRITGTVDGIASGNVTITTAYAGPLVIAMANVANM